MITLILLSILVGYRKTLFESLVGPLKSWTTQRVRRTSPPVQTSIMSATCSYHSFSCLLSFWRGPQWQQTWNTSRLLRIFRMGLSTENPSVVGFLQAHFCTKYLALSLLQTRSYPAVTYFTRKAKLWEAVYCAITRQGGQCFWSLFCHKPQCSISRNN